MPKRQGRGAYNEHCGIHEKIIENLQGVGEPCQHLDQNKLVCDASKDVPGVEEPSQLYIADTCAMLHQEA